MQVKTGKGLFRTKKKKLHVFKTLSNKTVYSPRFTIVSGSARLAGNRIAVQSCHVRSAWLHSSSLFSEFTFRNILFLLFTVVIGFEHFFLLIFGFKLLMQYQIYFNNINPKVFGIHWLITIFKCILIRKNVCFFKRKSKM